MKKIKLKILKWLGLIQQRPKLDDAAPKGVDKSIVPKQFDEKIKWDKDKFDNITYIN